MLSLLTAPLALFLIAACFSVAMGGDESAQPQPEPTPTPLQVLQRQAEALKPLVQTPAAKAMLAAAADLPTIKPRVMYYDAKSQQAVSESAWLELDESQREQYNRAELGEQFYYNTRYGTPLAYVRAFDLVAAEGLASFEDTCIFDFGYGTIGHLRLLASLGAQVQAVDVDSLLREMYSAHGDTGVIERAAVAGEGSPGSITLHHGFFPADAELTKSVGEGYDLFISKNTLKRGYIHPEQEADPRMLVHLGVDDDTFVRTVHRMLKPGGYLMIYNLYPSPSAEGEPYKPWADGRCPFDRELFEAAGFEVIAYNADDTQAARAMAIALGWDEQMQLETDLFGMYTLVRKRDG